MFTKGLSQQTQNNLAALSELTFVENYYLAGGTALSLHFGHRFSHDLDFFSQNPVKPFIISGILAEKGDLEIFQNNEGSFNGQLNGVKLSFFRYPYNLLKSPLKFKGIQVAQVVDTAAMKLDAVSSRGTKRDFVDLYFICQQEFSLQELILDIYEKKFSTAKHNRLHLLKSLTYFEDAEAQEMPRMIENISWEKIKAYFINEVNQLDLTQ